MPSRKLVNHAVERFSVPPDPGQASNLDDLVERLRLLKVWAGDPSYERITDRINAVWSAAGRPPAELARKTTVVGCFRPGRRRLNVDLVIAVVQALHADVGYVTQWRQALRVIGGEVEAASQVRVHSTLPRDLPEFLGRTSELDRLHRAGDDARRDGGAVVISAISGMAGVGKTQLAIHAAHRLMREEAFDLALFVNLRGFHPDPAQPPAEPAAVLDGFLRVLGMPGQQIPHDLPARTAAYRDRLAGTRCLVILDNAADMHQVQPLLARTPGCLTLITSRRSLTDIASAAHLTVDVFTPAEALAFVTDATADVPVGSDPRAAERIARCCGYLPLALSLVTGHILSKTGWTLTDHADRLEQRRRQRRLDTGVELALTLSYQHLPADHQRLLRLAALHPGQDFDAHAAAALTDTDLPTVRDRLHHLCRDHLMQQATPGRYTLHDLVRAYAGDRAVDEEPPPHRHAALTRLFDYYLTATVTAAKLAYPYERHRPAATPPAEACAADPSSTLDLAGAGQADRWLDTELPNLLATARHAAKDGQPEHVWHLSAGLDRHLLTRGRHQDALALHQSAVLLARRLGNHQAEMDALNSLGSVHVRLGRYDLAGDDFEAALRIARLIGDRFGELAALHGYGDVHWMLGRHELAGDHFDAALRIARLIGDRVGELNALTGLASVHRMLGRLEPAGDHYAQALGIAQAIGHRVGELSALTGLGRVDRMLGRYERAGDHFGQALRIAQAIGNRGNELNALNGLGHVHRAMGRHSEAADCFQQVYDLAGELGNRNWQYEALQGLGRLHHATGHPDLALRCHGQALAYATELAQVPDQARAHDGLAHAHHALNQHDQARQHWQQALDILTGLGINQTADIEASVPVIREHLTGLDQRV